MKTDFKKVCKDCTHFKVATKYGRDWAACGATVNLVTGEPATVHAYDMRSKKGVCGPEGRLYEAKAVKEAAE